jgi:integrase
LQAAPKIKLLANHDKRQPYPLNWEEQSRLFRELPVHLAEMALFAVNTGCRDAEICNLRWEWEILIPQLSTSVFIIPGERVKNGQDRVVVLNRIARSVIDTRRGQHARNVFAFDGRPVARMLNSAWKNEAAPIRQTSRRRDQAWLYFCQAASFCCCCFFCFVFFASVEKRAARA